MSISGTDNANALGAGAGKIPDTASKVPQQLSISTKVTTFQDVQRSLEEVKAILEQLSAKQIPSSLSDESETEGAPGSIRIIKTDLDKNLFEIKTEDGWQKPMVGQTQVTFKPIGNNIKESTPKSIDELEAADATTGDKIAEKTIFDEKADKFILARPDYDSGWVALTHNSSVVLTHNLELTEHPRLTQHYKSTSATPVLGTHNIYDGAYTWDNSGCMIIFTGANTMKVWSDNSAMGGSGNAFSHDSAPTEDTGRRITTSGHIRVMLWK